MGLPDVAVRESHQRIKAAFKNNKLHFPGKEVTINMSPADIRKEGSVYDLPIAIGILAVTNQVKADKLPDYLLLGELSLDGTIQKTRGVLAIALQAKAEGFKGLIVPYENASEAAIVSGLEIYGVHSIRDVILILNGKKNALKVATIRMEDIQQENLLANPDFSDVKGQLHVKRAFEIAAAGGHNLMNIGVYYTPSM